MTAEDYFAYVREYQQRLLDALLLARAGLADPTPEEQEEMETLYEEEDPFEEQALLLALSDREMSLSLSETPDPFPLIDEPFVLLLDEASAPTGRDWTGR